MKKVVVFLLIFVSLKAHCQGDLEQQINNIINTAIKEQGIKNAVLHIYSPSKEIDFLFDESKRKDNKRVLPSKPFYTASITKMFTAISIAMLKEEGKLRFEDEIYLYLPDTLINNLHVFQEKAYSRSIKISHLLQHTSGLPDYFSDLTRDGSPNIMNQIFMNPTKFWSPDELISFTKEKMQPHFIPGDGFYYTDTAYVLLAKIIENISGLSLDAFFTSRILEPLRMNNSYMNLKSTSIEKTESIMPFYAGDSELSGLKSLSADWGGGGLVSTTKDLIRFLKAYHDDQLITKETRLLMQNWVDETKGMDYGFGVRHVNVGELTDTDTNLELIGHTGSTAAFLWYCPQLDIYFSGSFNQLEASKSAFILVYQLLNLFEHEKK